MVRAGALHLDQVMAGGEFLRSPSNQTHTEVTLFSFSPQEQSSTVRNIFIHPDFDPVPVVSASDIGLLELTTPLLFTESVRPIHLPIVDQMPSIGNARVSGWGSTSNDGTVAMPNTLHTILLPVIRNEECQEIIAWSNTTIYPHELCTGNGAVGGIGTCGGDSGGGLAQSVRPTRRVLH